MSPKGRPVVGEPKNKRLGVRVTQSFLDKLKRCSDLSSKTQVEVLQEGVDMVYGKLTGEKEEG